MYHEQGLVTLSIQIAFSVNASSCTSPIYFPKNQQKSYLVFCICHTATQWSGVPFIFQLFSYLSEYRCLIRRNILDKNETAGPSMAPAGTPLNQLNVAHLPSAIKPPTWSCFNCSAFLPLFLPLSLSVLFPNLIKIQKDTPTFCSSLSCHSWEH